MRSVLSASLALFGAVAAHAQVVTEVKMADHFVVHGVGEVRLLGVDALGKAPGAKEAKCRDATLNFVYRLIHAKEVRLVTDERALQLQPALAMHRYVYLPDGRMLNSVLLESGCARLAPGFESLQFGAMLKSVADHAQMSNRGLYSPTDAIVMPPSPSLMVSSPSSASSSRPAGRLTLANFNRVALGMSFADVNSILGSGKEVSRYESRSFTLTSFEWETPDGSGSIRISFEDGRVSSKSQYGLQ